MQELMISAFVQAKNDLDDKFEHKMKRMMTKQLSADS